MNTTIRYWYNDNQKCKYARFSTYQQALDFIELLSTINVRSEVNLY